MKKELMKIGLVAGITTTSLFGFTYEIKQGWQQLGAIKDFDDLKPFDDASCIEYLWYYDLDEPEDKDKWKLHISDGKNYNYCGKTFNSLDKGDGFWLKASGNCSITVEDPINCPTDNMAPPAPPSFDGSCDANVSNPDNNNITNNNIDANSNTIWDPYHADSYGEFGTYIHMGSGHYNFVLSLKKSAFNVIDNNYTIKVTLSDKLYFEFKGKDQHHTGHDIFSFDKININGTIYDTTIANNVAPQLKQYVNTLITGSDVYFRPVNGRNSLTIALIGIELIN